MRVPVGERRAALVDAAFRVIARDGLPAATTRAICAEAGIQQGLFHYAYETKAELLQELTSTVLTVQMRELFEPTPGVSTLRDALRGALDQLMDATLVDRDRQMVISELMTADRRRDKDPGALDRWHHTRYTELAEEFLTEVADRFDAEWTVPLHELARLSASSVSGVVRAWLADDDDDLARASLRVLADAVAGLATQKA